MDENLITNLSAQKWNPDRINVFLNGKFAFGISQKAALDLQIGQNLADADVKILKQADQDNRIMTSALKSLSHRPKSESELQKKLEEKGFDPEQIKPVMDRLKTHRLIDDSDFAERWVENQTVFRPRSKKMLTLELRKKGVAEENISDSLRNLDEEKAAYDCGSKYARRLNRLNWQEFRTKLSGHLVRRGFSYDLTDRTVRRLWQEIQISDEDQPL